MVVSIVLCCGILTQVEGGVIIAPLVLHGALVVPGVRLGGVLKHEVMDDTRGDKNTNRKRKMRKTIVLTIVMVIKSYLPGW